MATHRIGSIAKIRTTTTVGMIPILVLGLASLIPRPALAQELDPLDPGRPAGPEAAAAHALGGGLTAAATAWIGGRPVGQGFLEGMLGGLLAYAGKKVAAGRSTAAGLVGRQIGALGGNFVVNAGRDANLLADLWLPAGPVWVRVSGGTSAPRARLDLPGAVLGLIMWTRPGYDLDPVASLRNGTLLFQSQKCGVDIFGDGVSGFAVAGVVAVSEQCGPARVVTHEMIHILQQDFLLLTVSRPVERWAITSALDGEMPFDIGIARGLLLAPWLGELAEEEAKRLAERR